MSGVKPTIPQSLFVVITGAIGTGKTQQILTLLRAEVDGEPVATPTLYILAESSAEGTAGAVLLDPSLCAVWPAVDCEEAIDALRACFPDSGPKTLGEAKAAAYKHVVDRCKAENRVPPPPPAKSVHDAEVLRSLCVDTASTLYMGSVRTGRRKLEAETDAKHRGRAGKKDASYNDDRQNHGYAARVCGDLIDRLNGVSMHHRGLITLVTVHTCPAIVSIAGGPGEPARDQAQGETPLLGSPKTVKDGIIAPAYSRTWDALAAKANVIWHTFATVPDMSNVKFADINRFAAENPSRHGVITKRGNYPKIGPVQWVKSQGGDGPHGIFAALPAVWHPDADVPNDVKAILPAPDLGMVVAYAIKEWRTVQAAQAVAS